MKTNQRHSNSISSHSNEQNVEPLLSSDQDLQQSIDGSLDSDGRAKISSICFFYLCKLKSCCYSMSIPKRRNICLTILTWIPVLFILGVVGWSYNAYVVQICIYTIENIPKKVIYLLIYHLLMIRFLWSSGRTIFTRSIVPPRPFFLNEIESENIPSAQTIDERRSILILLARQLTLPLLTRRFDGNPREK